MKRFHNERGQAFVLTVLAMVVLLGMAALVVDVGHWYHSKRDLQAVADSAALAGAQALPEDPGQAAALAAQYSSANGGPAPQVSFSTTYLPNDTIHVRLSRPEPGFFAQVFNIDTVQIGSKAAARTGTLGSAQYAAPFGIDQRQPELQCKPDPCTDETTLDLEKVGPGAFRILNLDQSKGGTGQQILADWILHGYGGMMPINTDYNSDSGAKFNASEVKSAMDTAVVTGRELLFPVYSAIDGTGANLTYTVIGWAGFIVDKFDGNGNHGTITGHFTRFIAQGIQGSGGTPGFGTWNVQLVE
jgi:Putative Flp pilus-assembly TadE/G-like